MSAMTFKGYAARVEYDAGDEIFTGRIAGIADIVGFHADTVDGLKAAFHEAVEDYIQTCAKAGKPSQKPFSGRLMLRVDPKVHAQATRAAELAGQSLNAWSEDALRRAAQEG